MNRLATILFKPKFLTHGETVLELGAKQPAGQTTINLYNYTGRDVDIINADETIMTLAPKSGVVTGRLIITTSHNPIGFSKISSSGYPDSGASDSANNCSSKNLPVRYEAYVNSNVLDDNTDGVYVEHVNASVMWSKGFRPTGDPLHPRSGPPVDEDTDNYVGLKALFMSSDKNQSTMYFIFAGIVFSLVPKITNNFEDGIYVNIDGDVNIYTLDDMLKGKGPLELYCSRQEAVDSEHNLRSDLLEEKRAHIETDVAYKILMNSVNKTNKKHKNAIDKLKEKSSSHVSKLEHKLSLEQEKTDKLKLKLDRIDSETKEYIESVREKHAYKVEKIEDKHTRKLNQQEDAYKRKEEEGKAKSLKYKEFAELAKLFTAIAGAAIFVFKQQKK